MEKLESINNIIIKIDNEYSSGETMEDGNFLHYSLKNPDVDKVMMEGVIHSMPVKDNPLFDGIKEGDTIFFHHNILRHTYTNKGIIKSGYLIDEERKLYEVPSNLIYAYKDYLTDEIKALTPFCFVRGIKGEDFTMSSDYGILIPTSVDNSKIRRGEIVINNTNLQNNNIHVGDKVVYTSYSEYDMKIKGFGTLYRMEDSWILGIQKDEL